MKKSRIFISVGLILLGSLLIAIAFVFGGEGDKIKNDNDGIYPEPIGTDSGVIKNSSTTGLAFDGDYKPVMAVIENSPAARPQTGLQTADVVYEVMVEGSITRFVSVFSDKVPEQILPIRSGRAPFLYIQQEWDGLFMHFGASGTASNPQDYTFTGNKLFKDIKIDLDGITGYKDGIFKRVNTAPAPHNVMGNPLLAQKLYNYEPKPLDWKFDAKVFYPGESVTAVELPFTTSTRNYVSYTYDFNKGVYLRFMSGVPFMSSETNSQLEVKNVIVQYTSYSIKGSIYKDWVMVGAGKADFYIGGMYVQGSWSKDSPTAQTMYKDAEGNPIVLKPGNTWIHIHPNK